MDLRDMNVCEFCQNHSYTNNVLHIVGSEYFCCGSVSENQTLLDSRSHRKFTPNIVRFIESMFHGGGSYNRRNRSGIDALQTSMCKCMSDLKASDAHVGR